VAGEVADMDINPGDVRVPMSPQAGGEGGAVGNADPPIACRVAAGNVLFAVVVEISCLHIGPASGRIPCGPQIAREGRRTIRSPYPPLTVLIHSADEIA